MARRDQFMSTNKKLHNINQKVSGCIYIYIYTCTQYCNVQTMRYKFTSTNCAKGFRVFSYIKRTVQTTPYHFSDF